MSVVKFFAFILLSLSANTWAWSGMIREGGVSGGGGNVINPQMPTSTVDPEEAEHIVKASAVYTQIFFAHAKAQFANGEASSEILPVYKKLFSGPRDLDTVLQNVRPHVRESGPCYDYNMQPVDASVAGSLPNRFCVSAFALSRKVQADQIPVQAAALMAHEYTEIMGLDEDEAVMIQKQALQDLQIVNLPPLSVHDCGDSN
ncbi:hypothetical protein [Bdellovibrio svalbardensis]|uniref:Uncharacterized protein n=1 Tax=Bdellovibrio svalbardensis TaxID=2972972 RepID=A0ABT6DMR6_9BACT|nr:hypothetical protein [Bdellovibrio svalbardensis]MDG0817219.1 hypothetical protein [Bdellovibrio svalbardensis]